MRRWAAALLVLVVGCATPAARRAAVADRQPAWVARGSGLDRRAGQFAAVGRGAGRPDAEAAAHGALATMLSDIAAQLVRGPVCPNLPDVGVPRPLPTDRAVVGSSWTGPDGDHRVLLTLQVSDLLAALAGQPLVADCGRRLLSLTDQADVSHVE